MIPNPEILNATWRLCSSSFFRENLCSSVESSGDVYSVEELGSCYMEITNNELSLSFIRTSGEVDDYFTIRKVDESCTSGEPCDDGNPCTVNDVYTDACFCIGTNQTHDFVTSTADSGTGSLRALIQSACDGDTILFDPAVFAPIILQSQIVIDKDLTIIGSDSMNILSGNHENRVFLLESGSTLRLKNLRLRDADEVSEGGAILVQGILEFDEVTLTNNFENGEPVAITNQGLLRVTAGLSGFQH